MRQRVLLLSITGTLLFASLLVFQHCGIYTTTDPLNPPFGQNMDMETLQFSGHNAETYFIGYTIYYKIEQEDYYKVCDYDKDGLSGSGEPLYPTLEVTPVDSTIFYSVSVRNLYPQDGSESFYELYEKDSSARFYFAVSAVGDDDQESERIEFGKWPAIE
jgi:hypothetical protein